MTRHTREAFKRNSENKNSFDLIFEFQEDLLSVWNKTATDQASTARIRDTLRRILNLPPNTPMEYKIHCDSLK